ncbi:MAG: LemA family protein [Planctomycetia bacterium]|nr:LemA family protein [Planctomycetia bacterium]
MSPLMITLIVMAAILVLLALYAMGIYNTLITLQNRYKNSFAQIDVQLKRRYDLIPNLVETAKGYLKHESQTLEAVTQARNIAASASARAADDPTNPTAMQQLNNAEGQLGTALSRLNVVMEAYPDLKANQNMMMVQEELSSTENRIAFARQAFNDAAMVYNTQREQFPANIFAGIFNFQEATLFVVDSAEERLAPKVSF